MSYKVSYRGLEIVVDSLDEVDALADRLESKGRPRNRQATPETPATIGGVVAASTAEQKKLLTHIINSTWASDESLREAVNLHNNNQIAGITSGLSKRLQAAGIDTPIIKNEYRFENGQRVYRYWIPEEVASEVKKGLGIED